MVVTVLKNLIRMDGNCFSKQRNSVFPIRLSLQEGLSGRLKNLKSGSAAVSPEGKGQCLSARPDASSEKGNVLLRKEYILKRTVYGIKIFIRFCSLKKIFY